MNYREIRLSAPNYLQVSNELSGDGTPDRLAAVKSVFLRDRSVQSTGRLTRVQFEVERRLLAVERQIDEMKHPTLGRCALNSRVRYTEKQKNQKRVNLFQYFHLIFSFRYKMKPTSASPRRGLGRPWYRAVQHRSSTRRSIRIYCETFPARRYPDSTLPWAANILPSMPSYPEKKRQCSILMIVWDDRSEIFCFFNANSVIQNSRKLLDIA